jgi:hypothetical protein
MNKTYTDDEISQNSAWKNGETVNSIPSRIYGMTSAFKSPKGDELNGWAYDDSGVPLCTIVNGVDFTGVKEVDADWEEMGTTGTTGYLPYDEEVNELPTIDDEYKAHHSDGYTVRLDDGNVVLTNRQDSAPVGVEVVEVTPSDFPPDFIAVGTWYHLAEDVYEEETLILKAGYYEGAENYVYFRYTTFNVYNYPSMWMPLSLNGEPISPENMPEMTTIDGHYMPVFKPTDEITIGVEYSLDLASIYPTALVNIDGKEYTLGVLGAELGDPNPLTFHMNRDHRIVINWVHNQLTETILLVAKR